MHSGIRVRELRISDFTLIRCAFVFFRWVFRDLKELKIRTA